MPAKITFEKYVAICSEIHGGKYTYDEESYESSFPGVGKIKIHCPEHGWFEQDRNSHKCGHGCMRCGFSVFLAKSKKHSQSRTILFNEFVQEMKNRHKNEYTYDQVSYDKSLEDNKNKLKIVCPEHGEFFQSRTDHLTGRGCSKCKYEKIAKCLTTVTYADFVADSFYRGHRYRYDPTSFTHNQDNVRVFCLKHGWFEQSRGNHCVKGCPKCGDDLVRMKLQLKWSQFMSGVFFLGKGYSYDKSTFTSGASSMMKITCPTHGEFKQLASSHLMGAGCPECAVRWRGHKIGHGRVTKATDPFYVTVAENNPQITLLSEYKGVRELITVMCNKGHVSTTIAENLLGRKEGSYHCVGCKGERGVGQMELEFRQILEDAGIEYWPNDRTILGGKELDLVIPDKNLAVEYNGAIWHSEKFARDKHHMNKKRLACEEQSIRLVNICSSIGKEKAINFFKSLIGYDQPLYNARSCTIETLKSTHPDVVELHNKNHVQGGVKGCVSYCLLAGGKIVAAMSFSGVVSRRGAKKDESIWELRRFVGEGRVRGAASRLLKNFLKDHPECRTLISFSDNRYFQGGLYETLGFILEKEVRVDYGYLRDSTDCVVPKSQFQKSRLVDMAGFDYRPEETEAENCKRNKWYRIWDCGKKKWVLNI